MIDEPFDPNRRVAQAAPWGEAPPLLEDEGSLDLSKTLAGVLRRWPWALAAVLVAAAYGLVSYSLTTKEYVSTTTIQIERKRLSLYALGQGGWLEDWWNLEYYPTQYRLLRSRGMAERVVQNLRLYENPAFTGRPADPDEGDGGFEAASTIELAQLAVRVQSGLTVKPIEDTQLVELSFRSPSPELAMQIADGYAEAFIQWGVETRSTTVGQASTFLSEQIETLNDEIEEKQRELDTLGNSGDFALDPEGEALIERQQTMEKKYNDVVTERISAEAAYKGILNLSEESVANTGSGGRVGELKSELFLLESEYTSKLATYLPTWPDMRKQKKEIDDKRAQLERLIKETYAETRDRAYAEFQKALREEQSLEKELIRIVEDSRLQNSTVLEYASRRRFIESRKELRDGLLTRLSETEMASRVQTRESNVRIVDHAILPSRPFRPNLQRDLSRTTFLGLLVGIAIILALEYLDRSLKTPEELENVIGLPTLAVIPDISESQRGGLLRRYRRGAYGYGDGYGYGYGYGSGRRADSKDARAGDAALLQEGASASAAPGSDIELLPHKNPRLAVCEAYRSLRTALLLSSAHELEVVAVTSAQPAEGKTVTASNLGVVFAQLDRRVLVLDADLRRPRLHKVFKVSNRIGLVSYLTGQIELDRMFLETEVPNLVVCPSGPIPPNPSELLASDRMRDLVAKMRSRFDFVLIDTPPTLPVADAVVLGPLTDGLIVCVRAGHLQRDEAKMCRERLRYAGIRVLGTVLNRYRTSAGRYNKRYHYYGVYEEPGPPQKVSAA